MSTALAERLTSKIPPHNLEAERAVLGALLLEHEAQPRILDRLRATDFYKESHRKIFEAILGTVQAEQGVDLVTLAEVLGQQHELEGVGGAAYLGLLVEEAALLSHLDSYAAIVHEKAELRELIRLGTTIVDRAYENGQLPIDLIGTATRQLEVLARRAAPAGTAAAPVPIELTELLDRTYPDEAGIVGGGIIVPRSLTVTGGGPKLGKSALITNLVLKRSCGLHGLASRLRLARHSLSRPRSPRPSCRSA